MSGANLSAQSAVAILNQRPAGEYLFQIGLGQVFPIDDVVTGIDLCEIGAGAWPVMIPIKSIRITANAQALLRRHDVAVNDAAILEPIVQVL